MRKNKIETAHYLARAHFQAEPNLKQVFRLEPLDEQDAGVPIRLLEVVEGTFADDIWPVSFRPDPARGIDYPVSIIEISPRAFSEMSDKTVRFAGHEWPVGKELRAI